jgi:hypothetical protein
MDKTDIVHGLQYVEKLNIVLKTFQKTTNIGWWLCFFLELNVYIHEDVPGFTFICGVYLMSMVLPHVNCFIKRINDIIEVNYIIVE